MLLPALNKARESAKRISCASNMRQLAMAWIAYTSEYKGQMPMCDASVWDSTMASADNYIWPAMLKPYLGDNSAETPAWRPSDLVNPNGVFRCPAFPYGGNANQIYAAYVDYGMPYYGVGGHHGWSFQKDWRKVSQIKDPTTQMLFADSQYYGTYGGNIVGYYLIWQSGNYTPAKPTGDVSNDTWVSYRHGHKANVAFCDGHVASMSWEELEKPYPYFLNLTEGPWRVANN
jgi:prepilin-type processing-associated H-X9-DG protein